ncbi:hypothetical protein [Bacillus sp. SM2101]|uniref:hypothetical protein n=1 Tax=Bacillus sp. SM2101 TaxID=2805366 RepID=UPI001BDDD6D5|nr:hypothetical protein [Bacillus sp. SM2101]
MYNFSLYQGKWWYSTFEACNERGGITTRLVEDSFIMQDSSSTINKVLVRLIEVQLQRSHRLVKTKETEAQRVF